jgi:hypothetical protein
MKLPTLDDPTRYTGLYVVDFGEQVAVGYTAPEVEVLLDHERYRSCKVYKIYNAYPDGRLELRGVDQSRFHLEEGLFFYRSDEPAARADYAGLLDIAAGVLPPCRCTVTLAEVEGAEHAFCTALIYPAEYSDEIGRWLLDANYQGGSFSEGGVSQVTRFRESQLRVLAREQLWGSVDQTSRPAEEVLAATNRAVQR